MEHSIKELRVSYPSTGKLSDQLKKGSQESGHKLKMEKGLVVVLLCCAGALVAESMPTEEQQKVLELLQQELAEEQFTTGLPDSHPPGTLAESMSSEEQRRVLEQLQQELAEENALKDKQKVGFPTNIEAQQKSSSSGVVYTRWGSTECPNTATLVYFGRAGGAHYTHPGTAANYICLPHNPEYYGSGKPATYAALVYGSEYETWGSPLHNLANHNVPCAVCYAERNAMVMAPAKITCPSQWTREYNGYLMASYYGHASPKMFVCVDKDAQQVRGEAHNTNGALFYHARVGDCHGLDCPPYDKHEDLACVVCTK